MRTNITRSSDNPPSMGDVRHTGRGCRRRHRKFFSQLVIGCLVSLLTMADLRSAELPPVESVDAATRSMLLIDGMVLDAVTSEPIAKFTVTPGSLSTDDQGKSTIRWRDNLKREMNDGRLLWPRTSGFSVMRFRVTAVGYRSATTQRIWRGGPHTRIEVRLQPIGSETAPSPRNRDSSGIESRK